LTNSDKVAHVLSVTFAVGNAHQKTKALRVIKNILILCQQNKWQCWKIESNK